MADEIEVVDAELAPAEFAVVPVTPGAGEALTLRDVPLRQLAAAIDEIREWKRVQLAAFERQLNTEALRRMDERAAQGVKNAWTITTDDYKLSGDSPARTDPIDPDEARVVLDDLVDDGLLDAAVIVRVVKQKEPEYTVDRAGWNALKKLSPAVKTALEAVERPSTKPRAVRVSLS